MVGKERDKKEDDGCKKRNLIGDSGGRDYGSRDLDLRMGKRIRFNWDNYGESKYFRRIYGKKENDWNVKEKRKVRMKNYES